MKVQRGYKNRTEVKRKTTNRMSQTCRGGSLHLQLGAEPEEGGIRERRKNAQCHQTSPPSERPQAHGTTVDVRGIEMQSTRSPA